VIIQKVAITKTKQFVFVKQYRHGIGSVHLFSCEEVGKLLENDEIKQSLMTAPLWKFVAETESEKFSVEQDLLFESGFDREIKRVETGK
jgi:hypothetical protein